MYGFKKGAKPKASSSNLIGNQQFDPNVTSYSTKYANGGVIRGAGTGTSDDIKKDVPIGSYIMPADSTKQIGSQTLGGLGFSPASTRQDVPVNVSNGEYELPPEQVHAIGVQALDQMKGATHTPVSTPKAQGFEPQQFFANGGDVLNQKRGAGLGFKPRQSLADGGNVEWDGVDKAKAAALGTGAAAYGANKVIAPIADSMGTTVGQIAKAGLSSAGQAIKTGAQAAWDGAKAVKAVEIPGMPAGGLAKAGVLGTLGATALDTATTPTEQYRKRFGMETNDPSFLGDLGVRTLGAVSDLGNNLTLGLAGKYYRDKQDAAANPAASTSPAVTPVQKQPTATAPVAPSITTPNPFDLNASIASNKAKADAVTQTPTATSMQPSAAAGAQGIIRNRNSFSDGRDTSVGADGVTPLNPNWNSQQNQNAKAALFASTPIFGQGNQNAGTQPANTQPSNTGFVPNSYNQQMNEMRQINNARSYDDNIARQNELRMLQPAMFHGSQLTANQRNYRKSLLEGGFNANQAQYKQDSDLATQIAKQQMGDQTTLDNTGLQEAGANYRNNTNAAVTSSNNNVNNTLAAIKLAGDQTAQGFQSAGQRALANLYDKYAAATTDDGRSEIAKQIAELQGKNSDLFAAADGGTSVDASGQVTKNAPIIYNKYTGALANQPQALPPIQSNPAALKIKNDTSLSMDEKRKQLQALGY